MIYLRLSKSEALNLKIADYDRSNGTVGIARRRQFTTGRLRHEATILAPDELATILAAWIPEAGCEWMIPNTWKTGPWCGGALNKTLLSNPGSKAASKYEINAVGIECGIPDLSCEALRRFAEASSRAPLMLLKEATPRPNSSAAGPFNVVLGERHTVAPIVNGKVKPPVSAAQYAVMKALILYADSNMDTKELERHSGHPHADTIVYQIRRDADYARVIETPGKRKQGCFRIRNGIIG